MKVFLVRHADADADIPEGLGDDARALTSKARLAIAEHFAGLVTRLLPVDAVFTSPLVRSVQTAQLMATALGFEGVLRADRSLLPDMPVGAIDGLIQERAGESIVLVGHQPSMGAMASHLLGLQTFPKPVHPGTVIGLEHLDGAAADAQPAAKLLFYAPPGQPVLESV